MSEEVGFKHTISFGGVNCYLIKTANSFVLIDSGFSKNRKDIENALQRLGCRPGDLKLVLITHGDFDHTGNAAYLREKFGAVIAMHRNDSEMVERGDIMGDRKVNFFIRLLGKILSSSPLGLRKTDRFKPDLYVDEGWDISGYGLAARVIHIPGHSPGSLGVLTVAGDLYCGDLFMNRGQPRFSNVYIDLPVARISVDKLRKLKIKTVYPGHGSPFSWEQFMRGYR